MFAKKRIWPHQAIYWSICISIVVLAPAPHCIKIYLLGFLSTHVLLVPFLLVIQRFMTIRRVSILKGYLSLHNYFWVQVCFICALIDHLSKKFRNSILNSELKILLELNMKTITTKSPTIFVSRLIYNIHNT